MKPSLRPSSYPSSSPSITTHPSAKPSMTQYEEKKLVASDGEAYDYFGRTCSMSGDFVVIGSYFQGYEDIGAAYLYSI